MIYLAIAPTSGFQIGADGCRIVVSRYISRVYDPALMGGRSGSSRKSLYIKGLRQSVRCPPYSFFGTPLG
jgi:hypothetical protein